MAQKFQTMGVAERAQAMVVVNCSEPKVSEQLAEAVEALAQLSDPAWEAVDDNDAGRLCWEKRASDDRAQTLASWTAKPQGDRLANEALLMADPAESAAPNCCKEADEAWLLMGVSLAKTTVDKMPTMTRAKINSINVKPDVRKIGRMGRWRRRWNEAG